MQWHWRTVRELQADIECMKRAEHPWPPSFLLYPVPCCLCRAYAVEATSDFTQEDKLDDPSCGNAWPEEEAAPAEATTAVVMFGAWDPGHIMVFEWSVIA